MVVSPLKVPQVVSAGRLHKLTLPPAGCQVEFDDHLPSIGGGQTKWQVGRSTVGNRFGSPFRYGFWRGLWREIDRTQCTVSG